MNTATQAGPDPKQIEEAAALIQEILENGGTLGDLKGFTPEEMEAVYSLAYNLHQQGRFEEAEKLFQFLCFYEHLDKRFWMGLGACRQQLKQYQGAIDAYSVLGMLDMENPYPPLHAADCYAALGDVEKAESALEAAIHWSGDKPEYAEVKNRAELLLRAIKTHEEAES
ncbi:MAG TPA: CesD/SycD/LcrH family type III secretion system chaperone [Methylothermaceae bacterium]|nr:CesD/SycD/LcrH family type III secretion system chaperone [Methylothermaceae bacterium]